MLKLMSWSPPTIMALSAFTGFGYGNAPKPSVGASAIPDALAHVNPQ